MNYRKGEIKMVRLTLYKKNNCDSEFTVHLIGDVKGYCYYKERIFAKMNDYFSVILSSSLVNDILNQGAEFDKEKEINASEEIVIPICKDEYLVYNLKKISF